MLKRNEWEQLVPPVFQCLPCLLSPPGQLLPFLRLLEILLDEVTFAREQDNLQRPFKGSVLIQGGGRYGIKPLINQK